jgi:CubicO group peptidase (beta-lactamase class C family)
MLRRALATAPAALCLALAASAQEPRLVTPEAAEVFKADMRGYVDRGNAPGIITYVVEDGEVMLADAYGIANVDTGAPMATDTLIRIASLSKIITSVAMLMLYEEGKWDFDDPIALHVPEFADLKVITPEGELVAPAHAPTMGELMTHTAGFGGYFGGGPAGAAYAEADPLGSSASLDEMLEKFGRLPLLYEPGTQWVYSLSSDIQGAVVERLSGRPFPEFLEERIFEPLGMVETGFTVSPDALGRAAALHGPGPDGGFVVAGGAGFSEVGADFTVMPAVPSGGGGMWSTVEDYTKFLRMLMNRGELDGVRLLEPETAQRMLENQLPEGLTATASVRNAEWSYSLAITADPSVSGQALPGDMLSWPGIFGVYWWADPREDLIVFTVMQAPVTLGRGRENLGEVGPASFYGALGG